MDVILQETDPSEKKQFEEKEKQNPKADVELPEVKEDQVIVQKSEHGKRTPSGAEFGEMYEKSDVFKQAKKDFDTAKSTQKDYPQLSALKGNIHLESQGKLTLIENLGQYATNVFKQTAVLTKRA